MKDSSKSIRQVMVVFLFCFVALISYIAYFQFFSAPKISQSNENKRVWARRNEVLRGTIYDRDGNALTESARADALTQKRTYVNGPLYVHALGYVSPIYGLTGLESSYDSQLTTYNSFTNNISNLFKDFSMDKLKSMFENRAESDNKIGNSVITTLDPQLQQTAFDALGDNKGAVVALNPRTGEVLAMVSKPTYDPNNLKAAIEAANSGSADDSPLINRATYGMYPPGSTFKTVTLASALQNIPDATTRTFNDTGKLVFNNSYSLSNVNGAANGVINLKQGFNASSNFVFGTLGMELGNENLKKTAEDFGFNQSIKANGFKIAKSQFPKLESYEIGNMAQSGIGQGSVLATPMQMALVAATVANDGDMALPNLVSKVVDKDGNTVKTPGIEFKKNVISKSDAAIIQDYMKNYVDSRADSSWTYFQGTGAAGKTGTADYKLSDGTDAKPHSWFIGFAPADNPQIAVAVIVENGGYGSVAAAQAAGKVIRTEVLK